MRRCLSMISWALLIPVIVPRGCDIESGGSPQCAERPSAVTPGPLRGASVQPGRRIRLGPVAVPPFLGLITHNTRALTERAARTRGHSTKPCSAPPPGPTRRQLQDCVWPDAWEGCHTRPLGCRVGGHHKRDPQSPTVRGRQRHQEVHPPGSLLARHNEINSATANRTAERPPAMTATMSSPERSSCPCAHRSIRLRATYPSVDDLDQ